jgi:hypothetical protein
MRYIIMAAMLAALTPIAVAQMTQGNMGGTGTNNMPNRTTMPPAGPMAGQSGAENCGTPDEPKACPPLPRHPLPYYPANKQ